MRIIYRFHIYPGKRMLIPKCCYCFVVQSTLHNWMFALPDGFFGPSKLHRHLFKTLMEINGTVLNQVFHLFIKNRYSLKLGLLFVWESITTFKSCIIKFKKSVDSLSSYSSDFCSRAPYITAEQRETFWTEQESTSRNVICYRRLQIPSTGINWRSSFAINEWPKMVSFCVAAVLATVRVGTPVFTIVRENIFHKSANF